MATKDGLFYRTPSCSIQVFTFCCFTIRECHSSIFFQTMNYTDNATSFLKMTKKVYIDEHLYWYTLVMIWQTVFVTFVQVKVPAIWRCWYLEQAEYTLDWHPAHAFLWRPVEWPCWSMEIHETDLQIPFINTYAFLWWFQPTTLDHTNNRHIAQVHTVQGWLLISQLHQVAPCFIICNFRLISDCCLEVVIITWGPSDLQCLLGGWYITMVGTCACMV